jgi:hypothetical protein
VQTLSLPTEHARALDRVWGQAQRWRGNDDDDD